MLLVRFASFLPTTFPGQYYYHPQILAHQVLSQSSSPDAMAHSQLARPWWMATKRGTFVHA